ncbi:MAG: hypothetical protein C0485_09455 [Pirellula sp.]|nr:hypothetical protein [Pirellula sp.]
MESRVATAQEVSVEFENFSTDFPLFHNYTQPGPAIIAAPTGGIGGSGAISLGGDHELTYAPTSFAFHRDGDAVTISSFLKTGALAQNLGASEKIAELYVTTDAAVAPSAGFDSREFVATVYRASSSAFVQFTSEDDEGLPTYSPISSAGLMSNTWYELSATFRRRGQRQVDASLVMYAYLNNGQSRLTGVAAQTSATFSKVSQGLADETWFGGIGADANQGVNVDRFRMDVPPAVGQLQKISIAPTFDVELQPFSTPKIVDGGAIININNASFPYPKGLMEFDLSTIPANAEILSAELVFQPKFYASGTLRAVGYAGDGLATDADPASPSKSLGTLAGPFAANSINRLWLDSTYVESLLGSPTQLGLVLDMLTTNSSMQMFASESSTGTPLRLEIKFDAAPPNGDFDDDNDVDGADFLAWQRGNSPRPRSAADLSHWRRYFANAPPVGANAATIPEPTTLLPALVASVSMLATRQRRR